jgi:hypothetical protein
MGIRGPRNDREEYLNRVRVWAKEQGLISTSLHQAGRIPATTIKAYEEAHSESKPIVKPKESAFMEAIRAWANDTGIFIQEDKPIPDKIVEVYKQVHKIGIEETKPKDGMAAVFPDEPNMTYTVVGNSGLNAPWDYGPFTGRKGKR